MAVKKKTQKVATAVNGHQIAMEPLTKNLKASRLADPAEAPEDEDSGEEEVFMGVDSDDEDEDDEMDDDEEDVDDENGLDLPEGSDDEDDLEDEEDIDMAADDDEDETFHTALESSTPSRPRERLSPSAIPLTASSAISTSSLTGATDAATTALLHPDSSKPTPYIHDAGHLMISDPNPITLPHTFGNNHAPVLLRTKLEEQLSATARDSAQSLLNHLLSTCPIHKESMTSTSGSGVTLMLPPPVYQLPRSKRVPVPKQPTKWEAFAKKKGIGKYGNVMKQGNLTADGELRAGKMVYDEAKGDWVPKWGYKGKNKSGEQDWLVEVDEKKERAKGEAHDARKESRDERKQRIKRQERKQRANESRAVKAGRS